MSTRLTALPCLATTVADAFIRTRIWKALDLDAGGTISIDELMGVVDNLCRVMCASPARAAREVWPVLSLTARRGYDWTETTTRSSTSRSASSLRSRRVGIDIEEHNPDPDHVRADGLLMLMPVPASSSLPRAGELFWNTFGICTTLEM